MQEFYPEIGFKGAGRDNRALASLTESQIGAMLEAEGFQADPGRVLSAANAGMLVWAAERLTFTADWQHVYKAAK